MQIRLDIIQVPPCDGCRLAGSCNLIDAGFEALWLFPAPVISKYMGSVGNLGFNSQSSSDVNLFSHLRELKRLQNYKQKFK